MRRDDSSPAAYRKSVEGDQRKLLDAVRKIIRAAAPGTKETIEHGMLAYPGVACLGAQKHYVALYVNPEVLARHRDTFAGLSCGKSCLRFKRIDDLDEPAVQRLLEDVVAGG